MMCICFYMPVTTLFFVDRLTSLYFQYLLPLQLVQLDNAWSQFWLLSQLYGGRAPAATILGVYTS